MKARRAASASVEPSAKLRGFDPEDWALSWDGRGADAHGEIEVRLGRWKAARAEFATQHGWPGGELARLRDERRVRRQVFFGPGIDGAS